MRITVHVPVDVTGHGRIETGEQEIDDELARLLLDRGLASKAKQGERAETDAKPPTKEKK